MPAHECPGTSAQIRMFEATADVVDCQFDRAAADVLRQLADALDAHGENGTLFPLIRLYDLDCEVIVGEMVV